MNCWTILYTDKHVENSV